MPHPKPRNTRRPNNTHALAQLQQQIVTLHAVIHDLQRRHADNQLALGQLLSNQVHTAGAMDALHRQQQALDANRHAMSNALVHLDRRLEDVEAYLEDEEVVDDVGTTVQLH